MDTYTYKVTAIRGAERWSLQCVEFPGVLSEDRAFTAFERRWQRT